MDEEKENTLPRNCDGAGYYIDTDYYRFFLPRSFSYQPRRALSNPFSQIFPIEQTWTVQMEKTFQRPPAQNTFSMPYRLLWQRRRCLSGIFQNPMAHRIYRATSVLYSGPPSPFSTTAIIWPSRFPPRFQFAHRYRCLSHNKGEREKVLGLVLCGIMVSSLLPRTSYLKLVADPTTSSRLSPTG